MRLINLVGQLIEFFTNCFSIGISVGIPFTYPRVCACLCFCHTYYQLYFCSAANRCAIGDLAASLFSRLIGPDKVPCFGSSKRGGPGTIVSMSVIHRAYSPPCSSSYPICRRQIIGQTNECHSKWMTGAANCTAATTGLQAYLPSLMIKYHTLTPSFPLLIPLWLHFYLTLSILSN